MCCGVNSSMIKPMPKHYISGKSVSGFILASVFIVTFNTSCAAESKPSPISQMTMKMFKTIRFKEKTLERVKNGHGFIPAKMTQPEPPPSFEKKHTVQKRVINGHPVYTISGKEKLLGKTVFYLHGGAYSVSFASGHWKLFAELVNQTGSIVVAPDYPLPPDADWTRSWGFVEGIYNELVASVGNTNIILMGDSAGGGFALALAQKVSKMKKPLPKSIILLSPWLDISMSNPEIALMMENDSFLSVEALQLCGKRWAGKTDPQDWQLSPLYGSFENLPHIALFTGTSDVLNPDAKKLQKRSSEGKGFPLAYFEYPDMMHVWMLLDFPESKRVRTEIWRLIR